MVSGCYGEWLLWCVLCIKVVVVTRNRTLRLAWSIEIRILQREREREISD